MTSQTTESPQAPEEEISLLDLALVLAENAKLLVVGPLAVGLIALAIAFLVPNSYTASTRILPPQQQQSSAGTLLASQLGPLAGFAGASLGLKNPSDLYVGMIRSRTVADGMIARFKLRELYGARYDEDARKELAERTKVTIGKDGLIEIEVEDRDPKRAADMANGYVEKLHELTQTLAVTEAGQRRLFFEKQLTKAKDDLTSSEITLRSSGINEATIKTVPQAALESLARLKAQVTAQEVKLGAMRGYMTESNPEYKQAQQELAALRAQLAKADEADSSKATAAGAEYTTKYRNFKYYETLFELMAKQYEVARLDEAREGALVQVVDVALPPERKAKPKRGQIAILTTLATGLILVVFVLARQWMRKAQQDPQVSAKLGRILSYVHQWTASLRSRFK